MTGIRPRPIVPFLDLDEALEELGYEAGTASPRDMEGFRFFRLEEQTPERRAQKREHAKRKYRREVDGLERRAYRKHPPGTPRHRMGDPEKRKAANRTWSKANAKLRRSMEKQKKADEDATRALRFVANLVLMNMREAAANACVGRAVYDASNRPDLAKLRLGGDVHEVAARVDFAMYLMHPLRRWSIQDVMRLFEVSQATVRGWIAQRHVDKK